MQQYMMHLTAAGHNRASWCQMSPDVDMLFCNSTTPAGETKYCALSSLILVALKFPLAMLHWTCWSLWSNESSKLYLSLSIKKLCITQIALIKHPQPYLVPSELVCAESTTCLQGCKSCNTQHILFKILMLVIGILSHAFVLVECLTAL